MVAFVWFFIDFFEKRTKMNKLTKTLGVLGIVAIAVGYFVVNYDYTKEASLAVEESNTLQTKMVQKEKKKISKSSPKQNITSVGKEVKIEVLDDCDECSKFDDNDTSITNNNPVISSKDVQINTETAGHFSVEEGHSFIDNLLLTEPINPKWAGDTENNINSIFRNSDNYPTLSENGLDYTESECRSTVCSVNFIPTGELDKMGKMRQMLALTSFFDQEQALSDAEMYTEYAEDGRFLVKLHFKE